MTKAERIYNDTRRACKKYIESHGDTGTAYGSLFARDDEHVTTRTLNAVINLAHRELDRIEYLHGLGDLTDEEFAKRKAIICMVGRTIVNEKNGLI